MLLMSFNLIGRTVGFCPQTPKSKPPLQRNKQHQRYILIKSFRFNPHISSFPPQTQKLEPHCTESQTLPLEGIWKQNRTVTL